MANIKSLTAACSCSLLLVFALQLPAQAQNNCPGQLAELNRCAPFVIPGVGVSTPNPVCCTAIQSVSPDCLCSTLNIISRLPSLCNLPPTDCGAR